MTMRQAGAVLIPAEGVEVVQGLHPGQRVGNHGDGAGRH